MMCPKLEYFRQNEPKIPHCQSQQLQYLNNNVINLFRDHLAEAYLGPYQTSMTELFVKIVNESLTIFAKKLHLVVW